MATTSKGIYYPNDYTKVADVPSDMQELAESVDAVIDDINNDINLANRNLANVIQLAMTNQKNIDTEHETNTQQDKDIANLKTENEELKAENERLNQDLNALPSNTAEGEYITLTDSADSRFNKFKVLGKSTQKTRSGKNIFNRNGTFDNHLNQVETTVIETGIRVTAKISAMWLRSSQKIGAEELLGEKVTVQANMTKSNASTTPEIRLYFANSENDTLSLIDKLISSGSKVIQIPSEFPEGAEFINLVFEITTNITINQNDYVDFTNVMVTKGETVEEYEEYGVMPSPDFPSEIKDVTDNIKIVVANSNLFGKGFSTPKTETNFWHTVGTGFTPLEDGWGRLELDNSANSSTGYMNAWSRMSNFLNVIKTSTKYKIVVEWRNLEIESNINSNYLCICGNNNQEAFQAVVNLYYSTLTTTNKATFTVTTKDNIKPLPFLLRTFISVRAGERLSLEVRISIQSVDTNADYEDGQNQQYVFPLQEGQVLREGDYLADNEIYHVRNTVVLTGKENWQYDSTLKRWHIPAKTLFNSVVGAGKANLLCNYFKYSNNAKELNIISDASSTEWYFYVDESELNGKTFPEWIQEKYEEGNPLTVEYNVLEEKQSKYKEPYTEEQQKAYDEIVNTAKTYKTVTNIFSTNEVSPKFEVNYRRDIDTYIDNKLANVNEQILNIAGGN